MKELGCLTTRFYHLSEQETQGAYLERDIDKEVGVAGTNGVKTDVAWVGAG